MRQEKFRAVTLASACVVLCRLALANTVEFRRGDANGDQKHDLSDAVTILSHLFLGAGELGCADAADVNDDGKIDISDPVSLLNHLFLGGEAPDAPYPDPGADPTADMLGCGGCGRAPERPSSFACGRNQSACEILEDVPIQAEPHFRNDAPAIALDSQGTPLVIFSVAEGDYAGFQSGPAGDGSWTTAAMTNLAGEPVRLATADLVTDQDGRPLALINSGDLHTTLWRAEAARWTSLGEVPGLDGGRNHALVRSTGGCLHAALETINEGPSQPGIGQRNGEWRFSPIAGEESGFGSVIALSPGGDPQIAYWATVGASWALRTGGLAGDPETVIDLGVSTLERIGIALELTSASEPHLLYSRAVDGGGFALEYRSKSAAGEWKSVEVAREEAIPDCGQPQAEGQTCEYEHTTFQPHRILADSEGHVLLVYSRVNAKVRLTARCGEGLQGARAPRGPPPPLCHWETTQELSGDILAGWIENDVLKTAVLAPGVNVFNLDVVADSRGQLHFAVYERDAETGNTSVRYLRVGER